VDSLCVELFKRSRNLFCIVIVMYPTEISATKFITSLCNMTLIATYTIANFCFL